ncbi:MAG TPA: 2Fe-2S iron-sulfur cluster-binding protein [Vicinamibacterales bacterium]
MNLYDTLCSYDAAAWRTAVETLAPRIHPIDRVATRIWFAFFPLDLHLDLEAADDPDARARALGLMGKWRLADQIDASHRFLFAHRYWPQTKVAAAALDPVPSGGLAPIITALADAAGRTARVDRELLLGMSAVALMTLRQVGPEAFAAAPGKIHLTEQVRALTPHQVMRRRARDDWQGLLGFTRGLKKRWTVTFDENRPEARFTAIQGQEIASAAQSDKRDYRSVDPRCTPGEGPIPVECRAASCGTCWVGVLGGAEKLSPVSPRDEGRRMKVFGYLDSNEEQPIIRLACQARTFGAVSVVIPPWNGIFGKQDRR